MNGKRADTKKKAGLIWAALAGILVLSMLASAAVSLWVSGHSDGFYRTDMEGNTADLYPDAVESFFMYDTPYENTYIPTGEDPQMYLYAGDQAAMDTLVVYLNEPAEAAYTAQLYFRREGENLTEENSRIVTVNAGESTVCFSLPADHYEELRLDMNGAFTVEAIRVGDGGYTRVRTGNRPVSWPRTLVTGLLAGLAAFALLAVRLKWIPWDGLLSGRRFRRAAAARKKAGERRIAARDALPGRKGREAETFLIVALAAGMLLAFLIPPFCAPDESTHFRNIWPIAHGEFFAKYEDGNMVRSQPREYYDYLNVYPMNLMGVGSGNRYSFAVWETETKTVIPAGETVKIPASITTIGYLPAAAMMRLGSFADRLGHTAFLDSLNNQLLLGRLGNLFFFTLVIYAAIRKAPHFKRLIALIGCMPVVLFLGASLNYDAVSLPVSLYFFALALSLCEHPEKKITWGEMLQVFVCAAFITGVKLSFAPFLVILLAVPREKYRNWGHFLLCVAGVGVFAVLGYFPTWYQAKLAADAVGAVGEASVVSLQRDWINTHVNQLPGILMNTLEINRVFYLQSFWGILGWLDTYVPDPFMVMGWAMLLAVGLYEAFTYDGWNGRRWKNGLPACACIICFLGTFLIMYQNHTPLPVVTGRIGGPAVEGVQGRYFIPFFVFGMLAVSNSWGIYCSRRPGRWGRAVSVAADGWCAFCGLLTVVVVLLRYWI